MKYISGNLNEEEYSNLLKTFDPTEEDVLDKKLPHVGLEGGGPKFFGNCIFEFKFRTSSSNTQAQIIPQGMAINEVLVDGERVELENNTYTFPEEGVHVVKLFSSDIWTSIGGTFINGWENLKEIDFPPSIENFDSDSIVGCSELEKLKFGKKLREISGNLSALGLGELEISDRNKNLKVIEGKYIVAIEHPDTLLGTTDGSIPTDPKIKKLGARLYAGNTLENFIIPSNIEEIKESVFEGCTFTGSLTLGEGLRKIESKAFYNIDLSGLNTLILNPETPPEIIDPEYFDIKDIDENGDPIEGVKFELEIGGVLKRYVDSSQWRSKLSELSKKYEYFSPFTLTALESGTITINIPTGVNSTYATSLKYSKDKSSWTDILIDSTNQTITIPVETGNKVYLRGTARQWGTSWSAYTNINSTNNIKASGNTMSLFYGDNFENKTSLPSNSQYNLIELFKSNTHLIDAGYLILPATTLASYCYQEMFSGCTSLISAPELPATTLADHCYISMFSGCTSLTSAPELPATTLATYCYGSMFSSCTSLTSAPDLPATILANNCYDSMFSGCTSLTTAPELPATILSSNCYNSMFSGCTSLTKAPELQATALAGRCYYYMFRDCTSLATASELPATTLADECYYLMFQNCTSLTTAPELPATTLAKHCYSNMFSGCTSLTTAPELPATTLAYNCYYYMFSGCTSLTTAPELPAKTLVSSCYYGMFSRCTALTTAPELPAKTLVSNCYSIMFSGCTNLNYIKAMFMTTPSNSYTQAWVSGVASSGTFVKNSSAAWDITGIWGIPSGWTVETASS